MSVLTNIIDKTSSKSSLLGTHPSCNYMRAGETQPAKLSIDTSVGYGWQGLIKIGDRCIAITLRPLGGLTHTNQVSPLGGILALRENYDG